MSANNTDDRSDTPARAGLELPTLTAPDDCRIRCLHIHPAAFARLLTDGTWCVEVTNGLPPDVQVVGAYYNGPTGTFVLLVAHPTFAPVPYGGTIPALPPPVFRDVSGAVTLAEVERIAWETDGGRSL